MGLIRCHRWGCKILTTFDPIEKKTTTSHLPPQKKTEHCKTLYLQYLTNLVSDPADFLLLFVDSLPRQVSSPLPDDLPTLLCTNGVGNRTHSKNKRVPNYLSCLCIGNHAVATADVEVEPSLETMCVCLGEI